MQIIQTRLGEAIGLIDNFNVIYLKTGQSILSIKHNSVLKGHIFLYDMELVNENGSITSKLVRSTVMVLVIE